MLSIKFARDACIHDFTHTLLLACIRLTRPMRIFRSQFFYTRCTRWPTRATRSFRSQFFLIRVARVGQHVQRVFFGRRTTGITKVDAITFFCDANHHEAFIGRSGLANWHDVSCASAVDHWKWMEVIVANSTTERMPLQIWYKTQQYLHRRVTFGLINWNTFDCFKMVPVTSDWYSRVDY